MRKIKIFIAGSKELIKERNCIKILANDLNSSHGEKDYMVVTYSYEQFNDNQAEYNNFIEHTADVVIFILDGGMGQITEEEFFKATESFLKDNRPEVMVFIRHPEEMTPEIARVEGLIAGSLRDKYYVEYSNLDELKAKARERILRFIDKQSKVATKKSETSKKIVNTEPTVGDNRLKTLLIAMACLIVVLAGALCWSLFKSSELLIFAGGGSVKNYIEDKYGIDIVEYPNSVYANLASGSAWALLAEEASRYQEDGGRGLEHFSSLCLSADDIDSTFINEKTKAMFANARIIRYNMGEDSLVVYVHNDILRNRNIPKDATSISVDSLRSLLKYAMSKPEEMRIFSTSKTSGTLRMYQSCIAPEDSIDLERMLDQKQSYLFYKQSTSGYINALDIPNGNQPYIILGSHHYFPQTLDAEKEKQYSALFVRDDEDFIAKPMNLYFVGKYDSKNDYCTVMKPIVKFLKDINASHNIAPDIWHDLVNGKKKTEGGDMILKLN